MRAVLHRHIAWVENRTGFLSLAGRFANEPIPASAGWPQAFGSVSLFLCVLQAATGLLLTLNFSGSPGDAYESLQYVIREVPMGRMIHAMHHWGASLLLIVTCIHMAQVFLYGAYKKPREATWIAGVSLFLLLLAFSLTGYILPWDNRAYWGTVVTTKIVGQAPFIGSYLQRLAGAADGIGVITFARFYSLHVLLLPAATVCFILIHLHLVRRHGVTVWNQEERKKSFFPEQILKDVLACLLALALLFAAALFLDVSLERVADPTDTAYVPRPEWYFLFLFQMLKFLQGSLEPFGSVVLPTLVILVLFCVPFVDRGKAVRLRQRVIASSVIVLALSGWASLTIAALRDNSHTKVSASNLERVGADLTSLSPEELAGLGYFQTERCATCHNLVTGQPKPGPTLALERTRRSAAWLIQHFKSPSQTIPGSNMPPIVLGTAELNALSSFLLKLTPEQ